MTAVPPPGLYAAAPIVDGRAQWPPAVAAAAPMLDATAFRRLLGRLGYERMVAAMGPHAWVRPWAELSEGGKDAAAGQLEWLVPHLQPLLAPRWVVGARDTTAVNGSTMCLAGSGQYVCTREPHDDVVHASGDGRVVLAVWILP